MTRLLHTRRDDGRVVNTDDAAVALVHHYSGALYLARVCSVWEDSSADADCVGSQIVAAAATSAADLNLESPLVPSPELFDAVEELGAELGTKFNHAVLAEWLQSEEDCGHLTYPIGTRA